MDVTPEPVERTENAVMFLRTAGEPGEIRRAWERLEALVGPRGRKFLGAFDPSTREYRAIWHMLSRDQPFAPKGATDPLAA
jgi:hypothetical protein